MSLAAHSNRRKPYALQVAKVILLYRHLLEIENRAPDKKIGMNQRFDSMLRDKGSFLRQIYL
jgi:hypothetical protein